MLAIKRKATMILFIALCLSIFSLEALFDLPKNPFWHRVVLILNIGLIISYFSILAQHFVINQSRFFAIIRKEKADVAYLLLIIVVLPMPRMAGALIILRVLIAYFMRWLSTSMGMRVVSALNLRPSQILALSFLLNICLGTILLMLPAATTDGRGASFLNALFMMTSANCVAGLSVVDIGSYFTHFGQGIILYGMQSGGLGIMVMAAAVAVFIGGSLSSRRQEGLREVLDISKPDGFKSLIKAIAATTIIMELFGAFFLFILCRPEIPSFESRVWWSIFHSVSAFCNSGLGLFPNSLMVFVNKPLVCLVFIILITAGGIGFFVFSDLSSAHIWEIKRPKAIWDRLQIQTKVVLFAYLLLDSIGMLFFLYFEYNNTLRGLSISSKIMASLFHTVSLRSAGFNIVPTGALAAPTILIGITYMFIGSAPGSTGGGIKVTTAAVSIMALRAMLRGREEVEIMGRRISSTIVNRSLSIVMVAALVVTVFLTLLLATQNIPFENLFFETVSAFGTVGLSIDTTHLLNNTGKVLIICVMYIGRIGPLTLALVVGQKKSGPGYQYPKGSIAVG